MLIGLCILMLGWQMESSAQCTPTIQGREYVCRGDSALYLFTGGSTFGGPTITWSVNGGGTVSTPNGVQTYITWHTTGTWEVYLSIAPNVDCPAGQTDTIQVTVIPSANVVMACNDSIQVSLGLDCKAGVTVNMLLEGPIPYPDSMYEIVLIDANGDTLADDTVRQQHIGQVLTYSVIHRCSGNSCWGRLLVEDKLPPPDLVCGLDTVECGSDISPDVLGFPLPAGASVMPIAGQPNKWKVMGLDNCADVVLSYIDDVVPDTCPFVQKIYRHWMATDGSSTVSCIDTICVLAGTIDSTIWPPDWTGLPGDSMMLSCDGGFPVLPPGHEFEGNPHPNYTGWPFNGVVCENIAISFTDRRFGVCQGTYKILREWTVIDWCRNDIQTHNQVIKVVDTLGPILNCRSTCREPIVVHTTPGTCTATYLLPVPQNCNACGVVNVVSECSDWTYTVRHKGPPNDEPLACDEDYLAVYTGKYIRTVVVGGQLRYEAYDLPVGYNWIEYTVTDACGNSTSCTIEILVVENEPPVPVCDEHTVVTIGQDGVTKLFAETLDDGSHDNCSPRIWFKVLRMDEIACDGINGDDDALLPGVQVYFDDFAMFCCADIGKSTMVSLRVFDVDPGTGPVHPSRMEPGGDLYGHFSECMVEVEVQDDTPPILDCPDSYVRVPCGTDLSDLSRFGQPTVEDDCPVELLYSEVRRLNDCGLGRITRTWRVKNRPFISCRQTIEVVPDAAFNLETAILWPPHLNLPNGCLSSLHPDSIPSKPRVKNSVDPDCHSIYFNYTDKVYDIVQGACFKILRTWTALDDCTNQTAEYTQYIKVLNSIPPQVSCPSVVQVEVDSTDCSAYVVVKAEAEDECTPSEQLKWRHEIDLNSDGTIDATGTGADASGIYTYGTNGRHRVRWIVEDQCGNTSTCTTVIHMRDTKPPSPYCRGGLVTVVMETNGEVEVWAKEFDIGSTDNCTPANELRFSFDPYGAQPSKIFSCDDIDNGIFDTLEVDIWVIDRSGNRAKCTSRIILQDNSANVCPDVGSLTAGISGTVVNPLQSGVENVQVVLNTPFDEIRTQTTNAEGQFAFEDLPLRQDYEVKAQKGGQWLNGVTTMDIIRIHKHLLGISSFNSPYQYIAADVNQSDYVSVGDIAEIRALILGKIRKFRKAPSWVFLPKDYHFANRFEPYVYPQQIVIQSLPEGGARADFVAVKMGDVNFSARTQWSTQNAPRTQKPKVQLTTLDKVFHKNEIVRVPIHIAHKDLIGIQFALRFDVEKVELKDILFGRDVSEDNVGLSDVDQGLIRFSWSDVQSKCDPQPLVLVFRAKHDGRVAEILSIDPAILAPEAYDAGEQTYELRYRVRDHSDNTVEGFALLQNRPNPFDKSTTIGFILPRSMHAQIVIYDITGQVIWKYAGLFDAGYNEVRVSAETLGKVGVLYYRLETKEFASTRKMLLTK